MEKSSGPIQFEVIVGTYEEFVLGYQFHLDEANGQGELSQAFATHSHRASVRTVACHGKLVVSGGADETINIYNMFTRKECGMLMEHNGTITSLNFTPDGSHVISTSEDGSIKIFRQGSWQLEKVWPNAHKGTAVTSLSVHPSGKMALSVGKDHTLRTWNLVKGRPAYTTNLYSRCRQLELVVWSPLGMLFAIPMDTKVEVTSTQKAGVLHTLELESKVTACVFLSEEVICVGEASGSVSAFSTATAARLWSLPGQERVRGLATLHGHVVTATSGGRVSVYAAVDPATTPRLVAVTDCSCRITCMTLYDYKSVVKVKKEKSEDNKSTENGVKEKKTSPPSTEETPEHVNDNRGNTKKSSSIIEDMPELGNVIGSNTKKKKNSYHIEDTSEPNNFSGSNTKQKTNSYQVEETPEHIDVSRSNTKKKKKNSSEFEETSSTKTPNAKMQKKRKSQGSVSIICSPRTQKWKVEDSKVY